MKTWFILGFVGYCIVAIFYVATQMPDFLVKAFTNPLFLLATLPLIFLLAMRAIGYPWNR